MKGNRKDLTGMTFGMIKVLSFHHQKMPCYSLYWECLCECGKKCIVNGHSLKTGLQYSCGCQRDNKKFKRKHGKIHTYEYTCWMGMKARCKNLKGKNNTYEKKGIKVSPEWLADFNTFLSDMGQAPSPKHTVDRINNDGDYCKENCRWATNKEQMRNYSKNVRLTFEGKTLCAVEWAELLGFKENLIYNRLKA